MELSLRDVAYEGWHRIERPFRVSSERIDIDRKWCLTHCTGDYSNSPAGSIYWFEKEKDAMMFKIANS
tara:strand:+ start:1763 stop:1966 length:204 start_codon:yes stop_codon:yes gene_type:complete